MASKLIPTFVSGDKLLTGKEATDAFSAQRATCNCGCGSDGDRIAGQCGECSAEWLACSNCSGQAIGRPLVYRTQSQIAAKQEELHAARPEVKEAKRREQEDQKKSSLESLRRGWDGLQFVGAEKGNAIADEWAASGRMARYA